MIIWPIRVHKTHALPSEDKYAWVNEDLLGTILMFLRTYEDPFIMVKEEGSNSIDVGALLFAYPYRPSNTTYLLSCLSVGDYMELALPFELYI